jgi:NAD(P)-dependent dehydrogenase (short-subunit alcohol dehydrogenase family)
MKNALITGASRGLGLALARQLAENGWGLLIDARGKKTLQQVYEELSAKTKVIAITGDITAESHRKKLAKAADELGGLDALINNASVLGPSPQPQLLEYPLDVLERVYTTNVIAPAWIDPGAARRAETGCLRDQHYQRRGRGSVRRLGRIRLQ